MFSITSRIHAGYNSTLTEPTVGELASPGSTEEVVWERKHKAQLNAFHVQRLGNPAPIPLGRGISGNTWACIFKKKHILRLSPQYPIGTSVGT